MTMAEAKADFMRCMTGAEGEEAAALASRFAESSWGATEAGFAEWARLRAQS